MSSKPTQASKVMCIPRRMHRSPAFYELTKTSVLVLFEFMFRCQLQQISVKAAATVFGRLEARCGGKVEARPLAGLDESALHACGLSRQKRAGMKDLSARVLDGRLKPGQLWRLDDEAVRESVTSVRGLGPWSAEIFLMFGLGRPDLLPTDDLGLQAGFRAHLQSRGKITPERMESVARPWRPWRTLACLYLWALLDNPPTTRESR